MDGLIVDGLISATATAMASATATATATATVTATATATATANHIATATARLGDNSNTSKSTKKSNCQGLVAATAHIGCYRLGCAAKWGFDLTPGMVGSPQVIGGPEDDLTTSKTNKN